MNCIKGDLARAYKPINPQNIGLIVRCVEFAGVLLASVGPGDERHVPCWQLDRSFIGWDGRESFICPDEKLRPIRDQPGADETLRWKEVPAPSVLAPKPQREHTR